MRPTEITIESEIGVSAFAALLASETEKQSSLPDFLPLALPLDHLNVWGDGEVGATETGGGILGSTRAALLVDVERRLADLCLPFGLLRVVASPLNGAGNKRGRLHSTPLCRPGPVEVLPLLEDGCLGSRGRSVREEELALVASICSSHGVDGRLQSSAQEPGQGLGQGLGPLPLPLAPWQPDDTARNAAAALQELRATIAAACENAAGALVNPAAEASSEVYSRLVLGASRRRHALRIRHCFRASAPPPIDSQGSLGDSLGAVESGGGPAGLGLERVIVEGGEAAAPLPPYIYPRPRSRRGHGLPESPITTNISSLKTILSAVASGVARVIPVLLAPSAKPQGQRPRLRLEALPRKAAFKAMVLTESAGSNALFSEVFDWGGKEPSGGGSVPLAWLVTEAEVKRADLALKTAAPPPTTAPPPKLDQESIGGAEAKENEPPRHSPFFEPPKKAKETVQIGEALAPESQHATAPKESQLPSKPTDGRGGAISGTVGARSVASREDIADQPLSKRAKSTALQAGTVGALPPRDNKPAVEESTPTGGNEARAEGSLPAAPCPSFPGRVAPEVSAQAASPLVPKTLEWADADSSRACFASSEVPSFDATFSEPTESNAPPNHQPELSGGTKRSLNAEEGREGGSCLEITSEEALMEGEAYPGHARHFTA